VRGRYRLKVLVATISASVFCSLQFLRQLKGRFKVSCLASYIISDFIAEQLHRFVSIRRPCILHRDSLCSSPNLLVRKTGRREELFTNRPTVGFIAFTTSSNALYLSPPQHQEHLVIPSTSHTPTDTTVDPCTLADSPSANASIQLSNWVQCQINGTKQTSFSTQCDLLLIPTQASTPSPQTLTGPQATPPPSPKTSASPSTTRTTTLTAHCAYTRPSTPLSASRSRRSNTGSSARWACPTRMATVAALCT
jgi:hypothetical protein